jgi:hypothetical protein
MIKVFVFGVGSILLISFFSTCTTNKNVFKIFVDSSCSTTYQPIQYRSIVDSQEYYNGRFVEVSGYFHWGFEESAISDSKSERKGSPATWVTFTLKLQKLISNSSEDAYEKMNNRRIVIRGFFDASETGHLSQYHGGLNKVCYIKVFE